MQYRKPEDKVDIDVWMRDFVLKINEIAQQGSPKNPPIFYENPTNYKIIKEQFKLLKETDRRQYKEEESMKTCFTIDVEANVDVRDIIENFDLIDMLSAYRKNMRLDEFISVLKEELKEE